MKHVLAQLAVLTLIAAGCGGSGGREASYTNDLMPKSLFTLHGHLDQGALALAQNYMDAEYVHRDCHRVLSLMHSAAPSAFDCSFQIRSARTYDVHLVGGSERVTRGCPGDGFILLDADECATFTVIGRTRLLANRDGRPLLSFTVSIISVYLNRDEHARWKVVGQGFVETSTVQASDVAAQALWRRRLPVMSA